MAEFPALPFFTDAYLADTMHLGLEEHGAYLKLLMIAWRSHDCALPDDDDRIAVMLGVSTRYWRTKLRPTIAPFWIIENGLWTQKRLKKVRKHVKNVSDARRAARTSREHAKLLKNGNSGSTIVHTIVPANVGTNEGAFVDITKTKTKTKKESESSRESESNYGVRVLDEGVSFPCSVGTLLPADAGPPLEVVPLASAVQIWNDICGDVLPRCRKLTKTREKHLRLRLVEDCDGNLERWRAYCERIRGSLFLTGHNDRGWRADFDFAINQTKFVKTIEGQYDYQRMSGEERLLAELREEDRLNAEPKIIN